MVTPAELPPDAGAAVRAALDNLRAALAHLRMLSAQPSTDPLFANAAEQIEAIVARIESRAASAGLRSNTWDPMPPNPG